MAINKPEIPSAELPEDWGGIQTPYTKQQTQEGYPEAVPTVIDGGNLNYEKRGIFQHIKYLKVFADWLRNIPIGKIPVVNKQGQLDYDDPVTDSEVVHKTGNETISGEKTFNNTIIRNQPFSGSSANIIRAVDTNGKGSIVTTPYYTNNTIYHRIQAKNVTSNKDAVFDVQIADDGASYLCYTGSATTKQVNFHNCTNVLVPTPAESDNSQRAVNTQWVNNKFKVVSTLPSNPDSAVFYYIPE